MALAVVKHSPAGRPAHARTKVPAVFAGGTFIGIGIAASLWVIATLGAIHAVGPSDPSGGQPRFEASLGLNAIVRTAPQQRLVHLTKFSRITVRAPINLVAMALPQKNAAAHAMGKPAVDFVEKTQLLALANAAAARGGDIITGSTPLTANALVETVSVKDQGRSQPFDLVLPQPASSLNGMLPQLGPLPLTRPQGIAGVSGTGASDEGPAGLPKKPVKELAYAKPGLPIMDDGDDQPMRPAFRGQKGVAYYDISAGVVYMPNGERLEAHSGIGKMRDNPDYVHVKMKGPTPPGTYKVTLRETLFHGVEAVRLTPTDGVAPHGRVGLLAHSYLLRNRGDSHGCVAFEEYPRFLKAFKRGEISQMVIVKSMKGLPAPKRTFASLFWGKG